jgi:hypothetical protein
MTIADQLRLAAERIVNEATYIDYWDGNEYIYNFCCESLEYKESPLIFFKSIFNEDAKHLVKQKRSITYFMQYVNESFLDEEVRNRRALALCFAADIWESENGC